MITLLSDVDFCDSGLSIETATRKAAETYGKRVTPPFGIIWNGRVVLGADQIVGGKEGLVKLEFLYVAESVQQGVDLKVDGYFKLLHGERIPLLRTWADPCFDGVVEYPYVSKNGRIHVWNVFKRSFPSGEVREDRWTENAGFWIEEVSATDRIYHCSHGLADPPDFEALRFRVTICQGRRPYV